MRGILGKFEPSDTLTQFRAFFTRLDQLATSAQCGFLGDESTPWTGLWRDDEPFTVLDHGDFKVNPAIKEMVPTLHFIMAERVTAFRSVDTYIHLLQDPEWAKLHPKLMDSTAFTRKQVLRHTSARDLVVRTRELKIAVRAFKALLCITTYRLLSLINTAATTGWLQILFMNSIVLEAHLDQLTNAAAWTRVLQTPFESWNTICGSCALCRDTPTDVLTQPGVRERWTRMLCDPATRQGSGCVRVYAVDRLALCEQMHEEYGDFLPVYMESMTRRRSQMESPGGCMQSDGCKSLK
jgi:hypothetical protein